MLDGLLDRVRRGVSLARSRGEEMGHATRLRLEVFSLHRELDGLYGRLGRAYHADSGAEILTELREEIRRVDEEIASRERLIAEIQHAPEPESAPSVTIISARAPAQEATMNTNDPKLDNPNISDASANPKANANPNADATPNVNPNVETERNQDYQLRVDEGQAVSRGTLTDADLHGSNAPIPKIGTLASNPDNIDRAPVQPDTGTEEHHERLIGKNEEREVDLAGKNPDPIG